MFIKLSIIGGIIMNELIEETNKTPIEIALKIDDEGYTTARNLYF